MLNRLSVRVAPNLCIEVPIWFPQSIINIIENRDLFLDFKIGHFHTYSVKPYKVLLAAHTNMDDKADIELLGCAYFSLTVFSQLFMLTIYTNKKED
jgi:hypothetical protein